MAPEHLFLSSFSHFFTSSVGFFSFFCWSLQFLLLVLQLFLHLLLIPTEEACPGWTHFVFIVGIVAFLLGVLHRSIASCFQEKPSEELILKILRVVMKQNH